MRYQDLKVRDAGRLAALGAVIATVVIFCVYNRAAVETILGRRYAGLVGGLAVGCVLCWAGSAWYLLTTPAQNARYVERAILKKSKNAPAALDLEFFDPNDPDYRVTTLEYFLRRFRKSN